MKRKTSTPSIKTSTKASLRGFCAVVRSGTRGRIPMLPYEHIRDTILGEHYNLSIAYVDEARSTELHQKWKHAPGPANILSFPYSSSEGEIILHLPTVYTKAREFDHTPKQHLVFLIVHGCLHLLGHTHGHEMEQLEKHWMNIFWE